MARLTGRNDLGLCQVKRSSFAHLLWQKRKLEDSWLVLENKGQLGSVHLQVSKFTRNQIYTGVRETARQQAARDPDTTWKPED